MTALIRVYKGKRGSLLSKLQTSPIIQVFTVASPHDPESRAARTAEDPYLRSYRERVWWSGIQTKVVNEDLTDFG
jgi:hypothetical protein